MIDKLRFTEENVKNAFIFVCSNHDSYAFL